MLDFFSMRLPLWVGGLLGKCPVRQPGLFYSGSLAPCSYESPGGGCLSLRLSPGAEHLSRLNSMKVGPVPDLVYQDDGDARGCAH